MNIRVEIHHSLDRFDLDVNVVLNGGFTALFGPSGSGKTSTLNVVAGLIMPARGLIAIDDEVLTDTAKRINVPAHARRIGYLFQDSRLFPHLTVRQNLAFGRWFTRRPAGAMTSSDEVAEVDEVIDLLDLAPLLGRRPARLSGGETRRVALGRALLSNPRLLLLDEPLGSLEIARRQEILPYLDRLLAEFDLPMIYVTHDWRELETRAVQVVRMDEGRGTKEDEEVPRAKGPMVPGSVRGS